MVAAGIPLDAEKRYVRRGTIKVRAAADRIEQMNALAHGLDLVESAKTEQE